MDYHGYKVKIKIVCHDYGIFEQLPGNHLKGAGCPKCGIIKNADAQRGSTEKFILESREIHGDKYDYSLVDYTNTKVKIRCHIHGVFEQYPICHATKGRGCIECGYLLSAEAKIKDTKHFIERAVSIHGNKYDYSKAFYENVHVPIIITCRYHGDFEQAPHAHYSGGCKQCGIESRSDKSRKSLANFISEANAVHEYRYNYNDVDYINSHEKITITCDAHGEFYSSPSNHLSGKGCPRCAEYGFNYELPGAIYILYSDCGGHIKVGISNNPANRVLRLRMATPFEFIILETLWKDGKIIAALEKKLHSMLEGSGFSGFDGHSEWFIFNKKAVEILIKKQNFHLRTL